MATVQDAATAYAETEKHIRLAQKSLAKVAATYKTLNDEQMLGFIEYRVNVAEINSLVGKIAAVEGAVMKKHGKDTKRAQALGIDVGPALPAEDIQVFDGGGR